MKKFLAIILALVMAMSLCACGLLEEDAEPETPAAAPETEAAETEAPEPEPEPPIEVGRFCEPDDMPEADFPEFTDPSLAIEVDGESYTIGWLYEHNIYDWREAGISFDQVNDRAVSILGLDYSDEAFEAIKRKVSDFTELMMLTPAADPEAVAGDIIVSSSDGSEDKVYDLEWLSSHNATEYTEAAITADIVKQYLDSIEPNFWYTREYRWIEVVYDRLVNGWE